MSRPHPKILQEIGYAVIQWSGVETIVEITCAYLYHNKVALKDNENPPQAFNQRLKYIRRCAQHPMFAVMKQEIEDGLSQLLKLATLRNELMHGAFIKWGQAGNEFMNVRSSEQGYHVDGGEISVEDIENLGKAIKNSFHEQFNLQDRMKATLRAFNGEFDIGRRAKSG